jgi:serine/threonine protein kinase
MSAVYRAYDTVMGRDVALKRLLPVEETNLNEASSEALAREAAALARFQHPNVVTVFAIEEDAEGPFVVMELVEGEDLHAIIKSGALSWEDFRYVAEQCMEPLVAAGDLNLLHRDIKPGNIMLTVTASGRFLAKLLDFGLAKFSQQPSVQTLDQRGSFLGSIDFIAPEQLELRPLDQRTDLYSLGCVFYYMLAQESPFTGGNPAETSMNHIRHRCKPIGEIRTDLPPLVADWLMRLVSRQPADRPDNAREALKEFHEALKGIPFVPAVRADDDDDDIPFLSMAPVGPPSTAPLGPPGSGPVPPGSGPVPPGSGPVPPPSGPVPSPSGPVPSPSGPVPSPSGPVRPPSGPVTRMIRTASGPIPGGRRTGPVAGAAGSGPTLPSTKSGRHSLTAGTAPGHGRPPAGGRPVKKAETDFFAGNGKWLVAGIAGAVVLLGIVFYLNLDGGDGESAGAVSDSGESTLEAAPVLAPLSPPTPLSRADGQPDPPPLPIKEGLFAWFSVGKGAFSRDYRTAAEPGGQIAAWLNLASDQKERSLFRDGGDPNGTHLPLMVRVGPDDYPALRGVYRGLTTTNRSALTATKSEATLPKGFTLLAVARLEAGDDRIFRLQAPVWDGRYVQLATGYDGKVTAVNRGVKDGPDERLGLVWEEGGIGVVGYRWDPAAREQSLSILPAGGKSLNEAKGPIVVSELPLGIVAIGKRGFGDSYDADSGNILFELILFERVLSADELKQLMDHLAGRYFR